MALYPFILYFFHQHGCHACKTAKPHIDALALDPPKGLIIAPWNIAVQGTRMRDGTEIQATPTYVLHHEGESRSFVGALDEAQLRAFIDGTLPEPEPEQHEKKKRVRRKK